MAKEILFNIDARDQLKVRKDVTSSSKRNSVLRKSPRTV